MIRKSIKGASYILSMLLSLYGGDRIFFPKGRGVVKTEDKEGAVVLKPECMKNVTLVAPAETKDLLNVCNYAIRVVSEARMGLKTLGRLCALFDSPETREMIAKIHDFLYNRPQTIYLYEQTNANNTTIGQEAMTLLESLFIQAPISPDTTLIFILQNLEKLPREMPRLWSPEACTGFHNEYAKMSRMFGPSFGLDAIKLREIERCLSLSKGSELGKIMKLFSDMIRVGVHAGIVRGNLFHEYEEYVTHVETEGADFKVEVQSIKGQATLVITCPTSNLEIELYFTSGIELEPEQFAELFELLIKIKAGIVSLSCNLNHLIDSFKHLLGECIKHAEQNGTEKADLEEAVKNLNKLLELRFNVRQSHYWLHDMPSCERLAASVFDSTLEVTGDERLNILEVEGDQRLNIPQILYNAIYAFSRHARGKISDQTLKFFNHRLALVPQYSNHQNDKLYLEGLWGNLPIQRLFQASCLFVSLAEKSTDTRDALSILKEEVEKLTHPN